MLLRMAAHARAGPHSSQRFNAPSRVVAGNGLPISRACLSHWFQASRNSGVFNEGGNFSSPPSGLGGAGGDGLGAGWVGVGWVRGGVATFAKWPLATVFCLLAFAKRLP